MEETKDELVHLCMNHPEGLSIFKIHNLYLKAYNKPLDLGGSNRLLALETLLKTMPDQLCFSSTSGLTVWPVVSGLQTTTYCSSSSSLASSEASEAAALGCSPQTSEAVRLNQLKGEVLRMLSSAPGGLEVPKLRTTYKQMYGRQLKLGEYGLAGLQELFAALGDQVCVERLNKMNVVRLSIPGDQKEFTQTQLWPVQETKQEGVQIEDKNVNTSLSGALPRKTAMSETKNIQRKIIDLVEQHPEGIPLKKLTVFYSQKYHQNLTLSSLGFSSTNSLVASLGKELFVDQDLVFHRAHKEAAGAASKAADEAKKKPQTRPGKDPPLRPLPPKAGVLKTLPSSTAKISFGFSTVIGGWNRAGGGV